MSYRAYIILGTVALLALSACSGKQTARTHVESGEHQLALGLSQDWEHIDADYERGVVDEHPAPEFQGLSSASRESALVDAQRLLELLNSGRADEALALIQQLGLSPTGPAMNPEALQALMAQLQGGRNASARNLPGMNPLDDDAQGLALPDVAGLDAPAASDGRLGSGGIGGAFDDHRKTFDSIGP
jgi:hypothetical protein